MTKEEYLDKLAKINTSEKRKSKLIKRFKEQYIKDYCSLSIESKYKTFRGREIVKAIDVDVNGNFMFTIYNENYGYDVERTEQKMNDDCIRTRK